MGWQQEAKQLLNCVIFTQPFHILTTCLLSLLLPLAFLLLARLSCYNYLLAITSDPMQPPSSSFLISLVLHTNPATLYALVSVVSIATLVHGLTGKITILSESPGVIHRPRLYTAWILLCTLQICVGLGIERSIAAGIDGSSFDVEKSLLGRLIFFLGLHETMLHWCRTVVKPVVDDTVFGVGREEMWVQRAAMAMSFGILWWWRLRDEVESLVLVAEAKRELLIHVGLADLVGWWLYYLTVTIGMVRIVKSLMWVGVVLVCRRVRGVNAGDSNGVVDKV